MSSHEEWTGKIRDILKQNNITMYNIIGSPGCGKTALLEKLCPLLEKEHGKKCLVLEGDVETANDAERLSAVNIHAHQIVTHGACHLSAETIFRVLSDLTLADYDIVFVENVGNLVCPAEFDIGEQAKIAVISVTEGEDKPLKYPLLFRDSEAAVITKIDLVPYLKVNAEQYKQNILNVNGKSEVFVVSSDKEEGIGKLVTWLGSAQSTNRG
ncbi:MAG: hydrogenase nickel incorporation protein HypB [Spirochaetales bacterium]|nr:hydrogenase nickel incorporation protein HypB [Spirochaetales bacterium]